MKIVAVSDTHGNFDILDEIVRANRSADMFIHLGDGEREFEDVRNLHPEQAFVMVRGNNDWGSWPVTEKLSLEGHHLYLTHGNRFGRSELRTFLASCARSNGCEIALFGHTHVPFDETISGVRLFNPGSPSLPRGMNPPSYGVITLEYGGKSDFKHIYL